ncbi:MAG: YraN family protein [Steroidobacteraceae bacterium]
MGAETTTVVGRRGEDTALRHLESAGLELLARNYRCRAGEIDLVMREGATLVLVEVRRRADGAWGGAAASVGARKQRRLVVAARHLLQARPALRAMPARFDVVAIDGPDDAPVVEWIRDAFRS